MPNKAKPQRPASPAAEAPAPALAEIAASNPAKRAMAGLFDTNVSVPPPVKKMRAGGGAGGDSALCKVQGIVLSQKDVTISGPKGPFTKVQLTVVIEKVLLNGAPDAVVSGVPGFNYLCPSKPEDTPEQAESGGGFATRKRSLVVDDVTIFRRLNLMTASFYKDQKDGTATSASACLPGTMVEINGVCAQFGRPRADGTPGGLFLNGGKPVPMSSADAAPAPRDMAAAMRKFALRPDMQLQAAVTSSLAVQGFFTTGGFNAAQQEQVHACQAHWNAVVDGTADRLAAMQGGKPEAIADVLSGHEQRVRSTQAAALASQQTVLFMGDAGGYDSDIAPLVFSGLAPWDRTPGPIADLMEPGAKREALPKAFVGCWIQHVTWLKDTGFNLDAYLVYVFDKGLAAEAIDAGDHNPLLSSTGTAIAMTQSLKDWAGKLGSKVKSKLVFGVENTIKSADMTVFAKAFAPSGGVGGDLNCTFPVGTMYVDMPATLRKTGVLVPEALVKEVMCEGNSQFVPDDQTGVERVDANGEMPSFQANDYQELTSTFKFSNLLLRAGMKREYRVVYDGSHANIAAAPELVSDETKGREHIEQVAAGIMEDGSIMKFLTGHCLVYAVAVPA